MKSFHGNMTKKDFALFVCAIVLAAAFAIAFMFIKKDDGASVIVEVNGELYGEYSLLEDRRIEIESGYGYNRLVIENGSAYMESADCPDKYCMEYKPISRAGESIICLPHRLVVSIGGAKKTELDGVAQ